MIHYNIEEFDEIIVISIAGVFTFETANNIDEILGEQLSKKPEIIAFDLKELDQIDSYGINHLFRYSKKAVNEDIKLIVYGLNDSIKKLFEITKLSTIYSIMEKNKFMKEYRGISS